MSSFAGINNSRAKKITTRANQERGDDDAVSVTRKRSSLHVEVRSDSDDSDERHNDNANEENEIDNRSDDESAPEEISRVTAQEEMQRDLRERQIAQKWFVDYVVAFGANSAY